MTRDRIMSIYCLPSVDEAALMKSGALEHEKWLHASRRYWLTIADLDKNGMRPLVVLSMHRNLGDHSADQRVNPRGKSILPARFYREAKSTFVPRGDLGGALKMADMRGDIIEIGPDVDHQGWWAPLDAGELLEKHVTWKQLPRKTHVGFRGPMMAWSDVLKMPRVYYV
jgi:hypothetical protein